MTYLKTIIDKLKNNNVQLLGCQKNQILELQTHVGHILPKCYVEFLESMGQQTELDHQQYKNFNYSYVGFAGESIFYDDVFGEYNNKEALIELLQENRKIDLINLIDDNVFVFSNHQGYVFAFFKLDEGDNPPVYGYSDGQERNYFPKLTDSLVDFFEFYLENGKDPYDALDE